MARRGQLGGFSTSLFGSGTPDFSAFDILDPSHEAYLKFQKVQIEWDAGRVSNDTYIAALEVYANALPANSSDRASAQARLEETRYTVARNVLVEQVNTGKKSINDLLAFDNAKLIGLNPDSQEYLSKLNTLRSTQAEWIGRQEDEVVQRYSDGRMTTQQLVSWYMAAAANPQLANNPDLTASIAKRIHELDNRVLDERDSKMLSDFAAGKVTTSSFLAYAIAAKGRYAAGTTQAKDWDERIKAAKDNAGETNLLYRYGLSQQYAQLEQFVKSNAKPAGGSSSSTRVILGADGQWHTVTSTKTTAPTPAELEAWRKLQVEIADAKKQMVSIAKKIGGVGGFTSSQSVLKFYQDQLGKLAKGSADWYSLQQKIDNVNDRIHSETVLSGQGIAITYPGGTSGPAPSPSAAGAVNLDQFMRAIARQESGGRYDARNSQTGAYGKYQILPSNWPNWAQQAGLAGNAPQTPANQERVARFVFGKYEKSYGGDWSRVAAAWFAGVAGSANPSAWGPNTRRYVASINSMLGLSAVRSQPTTSPAVAAHGGFFVTGGHESQDFNDHHDGIDIAAKEGAPIYAVADGTVSYARDSTKDGNAGAHWAIGGGNTVNIDVGGGKTAQFAHMSRMAVAEGARVKKGQLIGYVGHTGNATGPHVHFGLWDHATNTMVDPTKYLGANWGQLGRIPGGQVVASHSLGAHTANSREGAQRAEALTMHVHQQLKSAGLNPVSATKAKPAAPAAPGAPAPAEKRGPLQVLDSVVRGPKGAIAVHSHSESFPPNLDGAAFERFFSNYERAFESGAESFTDTSSGRAVSYFIGTDAVGRIERMRQLDDLRIKLYETRATAYEGTPTEITAANQRNEAVKDAAKHEYQILDMDSKGVMPPGQSTNPIAAGVRLLEHQKAAVTAELAAAKAAYDRGDYTQAFGHLQNAQHMTEPIGSTASVAGFGSAGKQAVDYIQQVTGGIGPAEALGSDGAKALQADLDRLVNWQSELDEAWTKGGESSGESLITSIKGMVKQNPDGSVVYDDPYSPRGQLLLADGWYVELGTNGKLTPKKAPATGYGTDGGAQRDIEGMVHVRVKAGGETRDAYAKYSTGPVGYFVDAAGARHPLMGKTVSQEVDGRTVLWVENPLNPGHWSNRPIVVKAPPSFAVKASTTGNPGDVVYTFSSGNSRDTYSLAWDAKTGIYNVLRNNPGGPYSSAVVDELIGSGANQQVADLFQTAGFLRDTTGVGPDDFADIDSPAVGFTASEYKDWRSHFQFPLVDRGLDRPSGNGPVAGGPSSPNLAPVVAPHYKPLEPTTYEGGHYKVGAELVPGPTTYDSAGHYHQGDLTKPPERAPLPTMSQPARQPSRKVLPPPRLKPTTYDSSGHYHAGAPEEPVKTARTDAGKKKAGTRARPKLPPVKRPPVTPVVKPPSSRQIPRL